MGEWERRECRMKRHKRESRAKFERDVQKRYKMGKNSHHESRQDIATQRKEEELKRRHEKTAGKDAKRRSRNLKRVQKQQTYIGSSVGSQPASCFSQMKHSTRSGHSRDGMCTNPASLIYTENLKKKKKAKTHKNSLLPVVPWGFSRAIS